MRDTQYTPELSSRRLSLDLEGIRAGEAAERSRAAAEAAAGGAGAASRLQWRLSEIGAQAANETSDLFARHDADVAEEQRKERLLAESRQYESAEKQKERDFREKLMQRGFVMQSAVVSDREHMSKIAQQQGAVVGGLFSLARPLAYGLGERLGKYGFSSSSIPQSPGVDAPIGVREDSSDSRLDDYYYRGNMGA